ncbi:MAG: hypothetical protein DRJ43_06985 [Thermoprotei archaeon]|nr:MAG: hypothetical protein DRJ43_06985 [Thermoprotei archaeon]
MRYRDLSYEEKRKVVSLVFEEAERMKQEHKRINYHELSRIIFMKTGVTLSHVTIRYWIVGIRRPMGKFKAIRRPPDEDAQIVRGLILTDINPEYDLHTIWLSLGTTKDFFAYSVQRFLTKYGWATAKPSLIGSTPSWWTSASLDYRSWIHELQKPIERLTNEGRMKLLSGVISGDGCITLHSTNQKRIGFSIILCSVQRRKAEIYHRVLESMSIPHNLAKTRVRGKQGRIEDLVIRTRSYYEYKVIIERRDAVKRLLADLQLLQPFREIKRILALRFIEKDMLDRDLVVPVWNYLRVLEKYSTARSQIRACELIPDEEFDKKHLDKQRMLKQLRRELYEYADIVRELKPTATRIISDVRPSHFPF